MKTPTTSKAQYQPVPESEDDLVSTHLPLTIWIHKIRRTFIQFHYRLWKWLEISQVPWSQFLVTIIIACFVFLVVKGIFVHQQRAKWDQLALPPWIIPHHYDLMLDVDVSHSRFEGTVTMHLQLLEPSHFIVFHHLDLDYVTFQGINVSTTPWYWILPNKGREYSVLHLSSLLPPCDVALTLRFGGKIYPSMRGFYRSSYRDGNDSDHAVLSTHFEPTDARRAFPCLDEPAMKATFNVSLIVPAPYKATGNMPISDTEILTKDRVHYQFMPTPKMSTYLVAFVVSRYENISAKTKSGIPIALHTAPWKLNKVQVALDTAVFSLNYLESTLNSTFTLPKMDIAAIPEFYEGAMENWGLMVFKETWALVDPIYSPTFDIQTAILTMAHELAHQFFGDHVTPATWSDLWLNEGFAEYMQFKIIDAYKPSWRVMDQFFVEEHIRALGADSSVSTRHPVVSAIATPDEIMAIFDDITYGKGASILRMLDACLSTMIDPSFFAKSLSMYLDRFKFGNARTQDLFDVLDSPDFNVTAFMTPWIRSSGFPIMVIEPAENGVSVCQEPFTRSGVNNSDAYQQLWPVFVDFQWISDSSQSAVAEELMETRCITLVDYIMDRTFIINPRKIGFYRTLYPSSVYYIISSLLRKNVHGMSAVAKAGFINDAFAMSWNGRLRMDTVLDMLEFLKNEVDYVVWASVLPDLERLGRNLRSNDVYIKVFRDFRRSLIAPLSTMIRLTADEVKIGNSSDAYQQGLLRALILRHALALENPYIVTACLDYFNAIQNGTITESVLHPDALGAIYAAGVKFGDENVFTSLLDRFKRSHSVFERTLLLDALTTAPMQHHLIKLLNLILTPTQLSRQDMELLLVSVAKRSGPNGPSVAWTFLKSHWSQIKAEFQVIGYKSLFAALQEIVSLLVDEAMIRDVEYAASHGALSSCGTSPACQLALRRGLEEARDNLDWYTSHGDTVNAWLQKRLPMSGGSSVKGMWPISLPSSLLICYILYLWVLANN